MAKRFNLNVTRDKYRSNLERKYAGYLQEKLLLREIVWWRYEPLTFRLAIDTTYTPDFIVQNNYGEIFVIELKGWSQSYTTSRTKWKQAAEAWPCFNWLWVTKSPGGWKEEEYSK